jgi:hypothetical protein
MVAREDGDGVSLVTAFRLWCDPELYAEVREIIDEGMSVVGQPPGYRPPGARPHESFSDWTRRLRIELDTARRALFADFRARMGRGEIRLRGVQTQPERGFSMVDIPSLWAPDFEQVGVDRAAFGTHTYISIRAFRTPTVRVTALVSSRRFRGGKAMNGLSIANTARCPQLP